MRTSKQARASSGRLDRLPAELILRITGYLSKRDAFNLATVCRSLQDAGEAIVWRDALLAIGYGWDDVYIYHPDTSEKELYRRSWIRDPEYMRRGEQVWSERVYESPTFSRHWGEICRRVKRLETAFRSRPARTKYVRLLTVEPTPSPGRVEWVVGEVLPNIEQLDLDLSGPLQGGRDLAEELARDFCDFLKTREDHSAARLRRVHLKLSGCPMLAEEIVAEVFRLGPNITELSLGTTPRDMAPITEIHPDLW
ncbi:hypothetical protein JCM24511_04857 [Saitozyma sp. JCM 24511]|nr:hypothetical protein JCM24511_04857 [Saitozyma sp. JCM 24511]